MYTEKLESNFKMCALRSNTKMYEKLEKLSQIFRVNHFIILCEYHRLLRYYLLHFIFRIELVRVHRTEQSFNNNKNN